jgi:GTP pyrophosphokinase
MRDDVKKLTNLFFRRIDTYLTEEERLQVRKAFDLARREHGNQRRKSGELFFLHPLTVADYLAQYHLDAATLSAALLHDAAEDTRLSIEEISDQFGGEVARLVDGVTKLKEITQGVVTQEEARGQRLSAEELQNASLQKLFRAMTVDERTVIIKLFDRLHNMRTIKALPPHKQQQKASETLDVFAPLANRLGMWKLNNDLAALSLEILNNEAYTVIKQELAEAEEVQQAFLHTVCDEIHDALQRANIHIQALRSEPENIYTVYQDLISNAASYRDIVSMPRLVILLDDPIACYIAMGYLHQMWQAVPDSFDDYISVARDNMYRSLHTTVIHSSGRRLKLRLRTVAMDKVSQVGVLARWLYADEPQWSQEITNRVDAFLGSINENIDVEPQSPTASVKGVVEDLFSRQIHVYTPRGEVKELAEGATAVDFAYAVHTELGHQCHAAMVNDLEYPLNKPLRSGDRVQIFKSPRAQPRRAWLDEDLGYLATNYARSQARRWFRRLPRAEAISQGKELLEDELEILGLPHYSHQAIVNAFELPSTTDLYFRLGRAELLPTTVTTRVLADNWTEGPSLCVDNVVYAADGSRYIITNAGGRPLRLCATCKPAPRDLIVGYVRQDGGATVHKQNCHSLNAMTQRPRVAQRRLKLGWGEAETRQARLIQMHVDVFDRAGLLYEITGLLQEEDINIRQIHTEHPQPGEQRVILELEFTNPRQATRILHQIRALVNVKSVRCISISSTTRTAEVEKSMLSLYRAE